MVGSACVHEGWAMAQQDEDQAARHATVVVTVGDRRYAVLSDDPQRVRDAYRAAGFRAELESDSSAAD
jgi:hypothetical protein